MCGDLYNMYRRYVASSPVTTHKTRNIIVLVAHSSLSLQPHKRKVAGSIPVGAPRVCSDGFKSYVLKL